MLLKVQNYVLLTQKVTSFNYYNNTSLANDYCYNEQLAGGEDLYPFVAMVTYIYVTIRTDGYSMRILEFTNTRSIGPKVSYEVIMLVED